MYMLAVDVHALRITRIPVYDFPFMYTIKVNAQVRKYKCIRECYNYTFSGRWTVLTSLLLYLL